jgi:serine/threonine protein kinase
MATSSNSQ